MAQFARFISKQISWFWSDEKLFQSTSPPFLPFYHVVSNKNPQHIKNYPYFNEKEFEKQLDYFLRFFTPVSLEEFYYNSTRNKKIFHLTFDDGLRECAEIIAPILLRKGIPATFFINSGFVDNKELFHRYKASLILNEMQNHPDSEAESFLLKNGISRRNILQTEFYQRDVLNEAAELFEFDFTFYLQNTQPYLSTKEIKDLSKQGFSIGGHSHKHPEFWKISEKKQLKHVQKSMNWVHKNIDQKLKTFAFPYTDDGVYASFIQKLKDNHICDITFGTAGIKYDEVNSHFQRYTAEGSGDFKKNLKTEFVYYKLRELLGKATVKH